MKVYTKTGDKGKTSLLGGQKVNKSNIRIEAYGCTDELNAFIGYLKDHEEVSLVYKGQLNEIQVLIFNMGSLLAAAPGFKGFSLPGIDEGHLYLLEQWIDTMDDTLSPLKNFIIPGGHKTISLCHVCRTVCRRAERTVALLSQKEEVDEWIIPFLNRLSDYFFVLSRKLSLDLKVDEMPWNAE